MAIPLEPDDIIRSGGTGMDDIDKHKLTKTPFPRLAVFAAWGIIILGGVLRLRQYFSGRSLWLDEAMLALNIIERDVPGLFKPLGYEQGAPIGFLLLEKLAVTLLGNRELSLRLIPFLTGCLALVLFYLILRRILSPLGVLAALAMGAVAPQLIYYSSEVKQYSSDVCVTLLLLWLVLNVLEADEDKRLKHKIHLGLAGVLALWFSHPALFVLAAIGIVVFLADILRRDRRGTAHTLLMGTTWLLSFGVLYFVSLRELSNDHFLVEYWQDAFGLNPLAALLSLFPDPAGLSGSAPWLLAIALWGAVTLALKQSKFVGILILVFLFTLLASQMQLYPFAGRLMLFTVPLLFLLLGASVSWLARLSLRPAFVLFVGATLLAIWLLYPPALVSRDRFISPQYDEHIRPAMSHLSTQQQADDAIYIYYWSVPAFRYYAPMYGIPESRFVAGTDPDPDTVLAEINGLKTHQRVWIIFSHLTKKGLNKRNDILDALSLTGVQEDKFIVPGTNVFLYLYDFRAKGDQ